MNDTHIFEPILAQLRMKLQESQHGEPGAPEQHLVHVLHVDDAEHEDELVEDIVPEAILDALRLRHAQPPEHQPLHHEPEQAQPAERYVYHRLEQPWKIHYKTVSVVYPKQMFRI